MNTEADVSFTVNAREVNVKAASDAPLIYVLRNDLNLKGTRLGCGEGQCGACTVLIDGRAMHSCDTPLSFVSGKEVETIEALLEDPPHPIVESLLSHNAWQCGFCIAGIIMQARALYGTGACLQREDIAKSMSANLCRCGAQPRILDALTEVLGDGGASD